MGGEPLEQIISELSESEVIALRRSVRKRVLWAAKLDVGGDRYDCIVVDLSLGGARLSVTAPVLKGEIVTLRLDRFGALSCEVVRQEERSIGVRFVEDADRIAEIFGARLPLTAPPSAASA
jgi:hypothetical protein